MRRPGRLTCAVTRNGTDVMKVGRPWAVGVIGGGEDFLDCLGLLRAAPDTALVEQLIQLMCTSSGIVCECPGAGSGDMRRDRWSRL